MAAAGASLRRSQEPEAGQVQAGQVRLQALRDRFGGRVLNSCCPRPDGGGKDAGIGDLQWARVGVESHVGKAHRSNDPVELTTQRARSHPDVVADGEGTVQQQDQTGEHVAQGLLGGDTQQDPGERPTDQQMLNGHSHKGQRDQQAQQVAGEQHRETHGLPGGGPARPLVTRDSSPAADLVARTASAVNAAAQLSAVTLTCSDCPCGFPSADPRLAAVTAPTPHTRERRKSARRTSVWDHAGVVSRTRRRSSLIVRLMKVQSA